MIGLLKQKARALVWRLTPCSRAKYNALILSLAEEERRIKQIKDAEAERLWIEDQAWEREKERLHEEERSVKLNREKLMQTVLNNYGLKKPKNCNRTEFFLIEDGVVKKSLFVQRSL